MKVTALDHLVLTVSDIKASMVFYQEVLGMEAVLFAKGRQALRFGRQKINLHQAGAEFEPHAKQPVPGSADLCLLIEGSMDEAIKQLQQSGVTIEEGPVERTGASGPLLSLYIRDPDGNLIELSISEGDYLSL